MWVGGCVYNCSEFKVTYLNPACCAITVYDSLDRVSITWWGGDMLIDEFMHLKPLFSIQGSTCESSVT